MVGDGHQFLTRVTGLGPKNTDVFSKSIIVSLFFFFFLPFNDVQNQKKLYKYTMSYSCLRLHVNTRANGNEIKRKI